MQHAAVRPIWGGGVRWLTAFTIAVALADGPAVVFAQNAPTLDSVTLGPAAAKRRW
jgi:hypothetical protein